MSCAAHTNWLMLIDLLTSQLTKGSRVQFTVKKNLHDARRVMRLVQVGSLFGSSPASQLTNSSPCHKGSEVQLKKFTRRYRLAPPRGELISRSKIQ